MRVTWILSGLGIVAAGLVSQSSGILAVAQRPPAAAAAQTAGDPAKAVVDTYCVACHNDGDKEGGFSFSEIDLARPSSNAEQAERVIRKVRSGMMPPAGAPRPDAARLNAFAATLESRVDQAAAQKPHTDAPELHRVNRREYRNSVRDLLGVDIDVDSMLPPDTRTGRFDNMSDSLTVTPALMQAYIRSAEKIARQAVGDPQAPPVMAAYDVPKVVNQMRHVEGTPFGTRGGAAFVHNFPADGEYTFNVELYYYYTGELIGANIPENLQGQQIEVSVDGHRVAVFDIDPTQQETTAKMLTPPIEVKAGPRRIAAAFVAKADGPVEDQYRLVEQTIMDISVGLHSGMSALPHLQTLTITGPLKVKGVSETPSRQRIFTCRPATASDEQSCAQKIITDLTTKAFRRPATPEDLEGLMDMYKAGRDGSDFENGVRTAVQAILASPEFIFRFEHVPANVQPGETYRISDIALASRLAYFLWSTAPDQELINLAAQGRLRNDAVLEQQVRRMLSDPRAETLATNFAAQWLRLTGIDDLHPEPTIYPDFTRNLATAMRREVELLFDSVVKENRNVLDLLTADYTFVNETLARHYGLPKIAGPRFQRVTLTDPNRFGLIGKGGILTHTSLANRTSPVARGKYVLEVLVGSPPPPPPPVVPPLKETVNNERVLSVRERMEQHRENPACSGCHQIMDPIGLTLENFDAIGRWRSKEAGAPIDVSAKMYDGTVLSGPVSLRQAVLARSDAFLGSFAEHLLAYGVGRVLDYRDMPTVRSISKNAARNNNRFSAFVMAVIKSAPFQMRTLNRATDQQAQAAERR